MASSDLAQKFPMAIVQEIKGQRHQFSHSLTYKLRITDERLAYADSDSQHFSINAVRTKC